MVSAEQQLMDQLRRAREQSEFEDNRTDDIISSVKQQVSILNLILFLISCLGWNLRIKDKENVQLRSCVSFRHISLGFLYFSPSIRIIFMV